MNYHQNRSPFYHISIYCEALISRISCNLKEVVHLVIDGVEGFYKTCLSTTIYKCHHYMYEGMT